ncbi:BMP family ABC transporter substrate-binding protein [Spiroplasma endosymbiont of Crioceris asparagi]|uniref:BMP family ABC transporter substrate-binding protein n=1 Tax=Spiroplasma endosymbiont of Crioceris asparagi TaxID=3066286 RepID=UPI0030D4D06F
MKKLILSLLSIGIVSGSLSSVVSCAGTKRVYGDEGYRAFLVTDGNNIKDHGFNEQAYDAIRDWGKKNNQEISKNYLQSKNSNTQTLLRAYKMSSYLGAETLVLPGFAHGSTLSQIDSVLTNKTNFIVLDASVSEKNKKGLGVVFESEMAGFEAGLRAANWATTKKDNKFQGAIVSTDNHVRFGTFAGISNKTGVDNFMWGFVVSVITWNKLMQKANTLDRQIALENLVNLNSRGSNWNKELEETNSLSDLNTPVINTDSRWYSNSFAPGAPTAQIIESIDKSDVIFPVAGPEVNDVIAHTRAYVIGVDTDQASILPKNRTLLSAGKNIKGSAMTMLDKIKEYKSNPKIESPFAKNFHSSDDIGLKYEWSKVFMKEDDKSDNLVEKKSSDSSLSTIIDINKMSKAKTDLVLKYNGKTDPAKPPKTYFKKDLIEETVKKLLDDFKKTGVNN